MDDLRVLLAGSSPLNEGVTRFFLEQRGLEVTVAETGSEVVDRYVRDPFDVVVVDTELSEADVAEVAEEIRQLAEDLVGARHEQSILRACPFAEQAQSLARTVDRLVGHVVRVEGGGQGDGRERALGVERGGKDMRAASCQVARHPHGVLVAHQAHQHVEVAGVTSAVQFLLILHVLEGGGEPVRVVRHVRHDERLALEHVEAAAAWLRERVTLVDEDDADGEE